MCLSWRLIVSAWCVCALDCIIRWYSGSQRIMIYVLRFFFLNSERRTNNVEKTVPLSPVCVTAALGCAASTQVLPDFWAWQGIYGKVCPCRALPWNPVEKGILLGRGTLAYCLSSYRVSANKLWLLPRAAPAVLPASWVLFFALWVPPPVSSLTPAGWVTGPLDSSF